MRAAHTRSLLYPHAARSFLHQQIASAGWLAGVARYCKMAIPHYDGLIHL